MLPNTMIDTLWWGTAASCKGVCSSLLKLDYATATENRPENIIWLYAKHSQSLVIYRVQFHTRYSVKKYFGNEL